jgi:hypothetical protein
LLKRILAAVLGAAAALNGLFMLIAGARWYDAIPSVAHTGPFNPHFVADIGAAFLAAGLALIARAWQPRHWPAAIAGVGFLLLHALIHVVEIAIGRSANPAQDAVLVIVPAVIALWAALPDRGEVHA